MTHEHDIYGWGTCTFTYSHAHVLAHTHAGLAYIKLGFVARGRSGMSEMNMIHASDLQTSAFPSELPRARFWEHKWCARKQSIDAKLQRLS